MAYIELAHKNDGDPIVASFINQIIDNISAGEAATVTTKGDIVAATGANAISRLGVGTNGYILTADSSPSVGMKWALDALIDAVTTKGDILAATGADAVARLAVGYLGSVLVADSTQTSGLRWRTSAAARAYTHVTLTNYTGDGDWHDLIWNFENFDVASAMPQGDTFTAPQTGYYWIFCNGLTCAPNSVLISVGEYVKVRAVISPSTAIAILCEEYAMDTYPTMSFSGGVAAYLTAGQVVKLQFVSNFGAEVTLNWSTTGNWGVVRLGI